MIITQVSVMIQTHDCGSHILMRPSLIEKLMDVNFSIFFVIVKVITETTVSTTAHCSLVWLDMSRWWVLLETQSMIDWKTDLLDLDRLCLLCRVMGNGYRYSLQPYACCNYFRTFISTQNWFTYWKTHWLVLILNESM